MSILEDEVWVNINTTTYKYYEKLGYLNGYEKDSRILVKVTDLSNGSNTPLTKVCDVCSSKINNQPYSRILNKRKNTGLDLCKDCSYQYSANTKVNNVKYEKSLEYNAIKDNKEYLLEDFSDRNKKTPREISYKTYDKYYWICPIYGKEHEYDMAVSNRVGGRNCPYCSGKRINHTNCLAATHPDVVVDWDFENNGNKTPYNLGKGSHYKAKWICNDCSQPYEMLVGNRVKDKKGCECSKSKNVKKIIKVLELHGVKYKVEYKFNDCISEKPLPFDFAIFNNNDNLVFLMEYDGQHHYEPVRFNGISLDRAIVNFHRTKKHDQIKDNYCLTNDIKLYRLSYQDENVLQEKVIEILRITKLIV
mgnify:CR=1 FL=1